MGVQYINAAYILYNIISIEYGRGFEKGGAPLRAVPTQARFRFGVHLERIR
jgi:hypothetical protein